MGLFHKFLIKEFSKNFLILLSIFLAFFLIGDFFDKLPTFLIAKKPFFYFIEYLFWKIQVNIYQIFPYLVALTPLLTLFFLSRSLELLAFISLGFLREEIFRALLKLLLSFSLVGGILLNLIVPNAYYQAQYLWEIRIEGRSAQHLIFRGMLFFEGDKFILMATPLEPKAEYLADLVLLFLDGTTPQKIIWAKKAFYLGDRVWKLEEAIFQERELEFKPFFYKNWEGTLPLKPKTFIIVEKPVKFASLKELYQRYLFLKKIQKPPTEVLAEVFHRFLYLFMGIALSLFPLLLYLKKYSPSKYTASFLQSLMLFFIVSSLFVILQTLIPKFVFLPLLINLLVLGSLIYFLVIRK